MEAERFVRNLEQFESLKSLLDTKDNRAPPNNCDNIDTLLFLYNDATMIKIPLSIISNSLYAEMSDLSEENDVNTLEEFREMDKKIADIINVIDYVIVDAGDTYDAETSNEQIGMQDPDEAHIGTVRSLSNKLETAYEMINNFVESILYLNN